MNPCVMKWKSEDVKITTTILPERKVKIEIDFDLKNKDASIIAKMLQVIEQEKKKNIKMIII